MQTGDVLTDGCTNNTYGFNQHSVPRRSGRSSHHSRTDGASLDQRCIRREFIAATPRIPNDVVLQQPCPTESMQGEWLDVKVITNNIYGT